MGGVCCKDGAERDSQQEGRRPVPNLPSAPAQPEAKPPAAVGTPIENVQQSVAPGPAAPGPVNAQLASSAAAAPAIIGGTADPAQVLICDVTASGKTWDSSKALPVHLQSDAVEAAAKSPRVAAPTLTADAEATNQPSTGDGAADQAQPTNPNPPPIELEQQASAEPVGSVPAQANAKAPEAPSTEQQDELAGALPPSDADQTYAAGNEELLDYTQADPPAAERVMVSTTRRPAQPSTGEVSSTASYSQSATSSQQPGSSHHHGTSSSQMGGGGGMPSIMGSSAAAPGTSVAGEAGAPTLAPSTAATTTGGAESMTGSAQDSNVSSQAPKDSNAGFMFGAPRRAKEHRRERRKDVKRAKSHSSASDMSGNAGPQPGSDATPGSKASGGAGSSAGPALPAVGGSSDAVAADASITGSDALTNSTNPRFGAPGSSYVPSTPVGGAAGDTSIGSTLGSTLGPDGFRTVGRRVKPVKPRSASTSDGSAARTTSASGAGAGTSAGGGGSALLEEGLPEAVPEGDAEGEVSDRSGSSPRSSSEHLSIMSPPEGSDVENVLQLICNIFQLPVALVAAYRSSNIFIRSTAIRLTDDDQWRYSLAQWSMLNTSDLRDVLMVPDATKDERFCEYYCVKSSPQVRFFMASPLRSSTGEVLGTLCMADFVERVLEPANLLVVNNLQTLVIRQLERDMALAQERFENDTATEKLQQEMMRALDHFEKCIMFVDTSKPGWEVLYTNLAWEHVTGVPREHVMGQAMLDKTGALSRVPRVHVLGRPLHDFFMALGGAALDWSSTAAEVASRAEFTVHRVAVRQKPDKLVSLHLRLATNEASGELEGLLPKGLPAWVKARGSEMHNYFVFVEEVDTKAPGNSTVYEALAKHVEKVPGLELSHLLGKGGFGSVYYGTWNGLPVAVKMIDNRLTKTNTEGVSLEALMGQELTHPNIVKTIKYVMRSTLNASSMSGSNSRGIGSNATRGTGPTSGHHHNLPTTVGGTSRNGSRNVGLPPPGFDAAVPGGGGGNGGVRPPADVQGSVSSYYMTSAQPGLSGMTSAQMAAALDLTSASGMQQHHIHAHNMVATMNSDATTAAGGGSQYSAEFGSGGVAPRVGNVISSTPSTPGQGGADAAASTGGGTSTGTSGHTAVGPASVAASSASTAAGPPSIASGSGVGAPVPAAVVTPTITSRETSAPRLQLPSPVRRREIGRPTPASIPPGATAGALAGPLATSARPPVRMSANGAAPPSPGHRGTGAAPGAAGRSPEQQTAAMTSRFSLAFSTITSNGGMLVPGKESPTSSSGPTTQMVQGSTGSGEDLGEVWIIMEFCDRGSLQDALDRGALKLRKPSGELGETHLPMMVATACEVASALQYLHGKGIVHGDLTAWNVMLCTASNEQNDRSSRNFTAKVADFGLSRSLDLRSKIKTRTYGTISHMPPECLISGIISKATDVFAFGVLLWQMYTGLRPWAGMNHGQIIYNVGMKNVQLLFPPGTPPAIADLSSSCTRTDPAQRPSFAEIMEKLDNIRASLGL